MTRTTRPILVVSSGRSGTAMLAKLLGAQEGVEAHHEYMVNIVQPLGVKRYMGLVNDVECRRVLAETHAAAAYYATSAIWSDASNKLSWLIPPLARVMPGVKFVHLVRDGRKAAGSYLRKLGDECYGDRETAILQAHFDDPRLNPAPPPEKPYWWPLPAQSDPRASYFRDYTQFERIAWHWAEINRVILRDLEALGPGRSIRVRLEDLRADANEVKRLFAFADLLYTDEAHAMLARPHNVNRPEDAMLTPEQDAAFRALAWDVMDTLGYADDPEYAVDYGPRALNAR